MPLGASSVAELTDFPVGMMPPSTKDSPLRRCVSASHPDRVRMRLSGRRRGTADRDAVPALVVTGATTSRVGASPFWLRRSKSLQVVEGTKGNGRGSSGSGAGSSIGKHANLSATLKSSEERKSKDADRDAKQTQRPFSCSHSSPTEQRRTAQYTRGMPFEVPSSLRTGSEMAVAALAMDAFYTTPFLQLACRETAEREVAARLRREVQKMSSKLHVVRVEGLKEATAMLWQWTTQVTVESAERQQRQIRRPQCSSSASPSTAARAPADRFFTPYDAVRVEVLGSAAPSTVLGGSHNDTHRLTATAADEATDISALRNDSWDILQSALEGVDYTSNIFNAILVPRLEVRNSMSTGAPISIQLSSDAALGWTTLPASTSQRPSPVSPDELPYVATAVTYAEQELALRYIQGACLLLYHQRRCCSEGCLLYYATEVFQCMRSHAEALFTLQRREWEEGEDDDRDGANARPSSLSGGHESGKGGRSAVQRSNAVRRTPESGSPPPVTAEPVSETVTAAAALAAALREPGRSQVGVDPSLVRVVVALVDAVEAACHYNPSSLRRLVQAGGVTAMLNLAYCPFMPTAIRAAVLNTISVLLQQIIPLRRLLVATSGAQGSRPGSKKGDAVEASADPVLQKMLENAVHDHPMGRDGRPIPFSLEFGSASKFNSAVRDWFFANGLGNVIMSVAQLQDLRHTFQSSSFLSPPQDVPLRTAGGLMAGVRGWHGGALRGAVVGGVGGGAGGLSGVSPATLSAGSGAAAYPNAQRECELHRKRIERLLERMDGRGC